MSSEICPYLHYVNTWEVYPRVYYFRSRFIDFYKRFKNVIEKLPDDVKDQDLLSSVTGLNTLLGQNICIFIFGKYDLTVEELYISTQSAPKTSQSASVLPHIVVCCSKLKRLEDGYLEEITQSLTRFKSSGVYESFPAELFIIVCKLQTSTSAEDIIKCRKEIQAEAEAFLGFELDISNIIVSPRELNVKERVSCIYEKRIIDAFVRIRVFLGHFVKKIGRTRPSLVEKTSVVPLLNTVAGILQNPFFLFEGPYDRDDNKRFLQLLTSRLAHHIRFNFINLSASKHSLPTWLCTRLCNCMELENELVNAVSNKTRYMLCTRERELNRRLTEDYSFKYSSRMLESSNRFAFIMSLLQRDFEGATSLVGLDEKISGMKRISVVMSKMEYEIDGYLKQTIVEHFDFLSKQLSLRLPDTLRNRVLKIKGVYGIGIIYDTIEVHLQDTVQNAEKVCHSLASLMKEFHLQNSYRIKQIKP